jgi:hypothetical protein
VAWLVDKLARSPGFEGRPDRREVEAALQRVAGRVLAQRDWHAEAPTTAIGSVAAQPGAVAESYDLFVGNSQRGRTIAP